MNNIHKRAAGMGMSSVVRHALSETRRQVSRAFRHPLKRLKKKVVRRVLKSDTVNRVHNAVLRAVAGELLLAAVIATATALTASSSTAPFASAYNFAFPCAISAACTEALRGPLNELCDAYTQPLADRLQDVLARRWDDEAFWLAERSAAGVCVGAVAVGLSWVNDPPTTVLFVGQTLVTGFVVGVLKNQQHPVRTCFARIRCCFKPWCCMHRCTHVCRCCVAPRPSVWVEYGARGKDRVNFFYIQASEAGDGNERRIQEPKRGGTAASADGEQHEFRAGALAQRNGIPGARIQEAVHAGRATVVRRNYFGTHTQVPWVSASPPLHRARYPVTDIQPAP